MDTRAFAKKAVPLLVMIAVGIAIILIGSDDNTMTIVGSAIEGLAAILLVSLLFWEVGRSEDRAREAERRQR